MWNWRINLILVFVFLFGAAIISRLFFLQILKYKFYQAQALGQQMIFKELGGTKGEIFFNTQGLDNLDKIKSLAVNKEKWVVYALLDEIDDKTITAQVLAGNLGEKKEEILSKLDKGNYYVLLKNKATKEEIDKLKNSGLKGVYWEKTSGRYYPQESLAADIVGFVSGDESGYYGLEGYYDELLKGKKGFIEDKKGLAFLDFNASQYLPQDGSDLYLTIDYNIQFKAESLLKEVKNDLDIEAGQIVVLEPNTGKVLAMADFPTFNPNQYSKEKNFDIFQNSAIQKIYEPGSVFKPITMAIALNEGKITPDTTYEDTGSVKVGVETIYNYERKIYGKQTMSEVLEKSINTGAVFVSKIIPQKTFLEYLDKFGFGAKTGIDLQGEVFSQNDNLKKGREINFATASFGQGIGMTPLQLVQAFCAIANGGKLMKPYVVEKIVNLSKNEITEIKPKIVREVISQQTASHLTAMLINVVENGFGKKAKVPGYYVAGKTGTAQVPIEGGKGYQSDKTIQSFIGYAPGLNPRFVILIKLDNPEASSAGFSAANVFRKMAEYIINYWQIPPDYE